MWLTRLALQKIITTAKTKASGLYIYDVGLKSQTFETRPSGGEGICNPFQHMLFSKLLKNVCVCCCLPSLGRVRWLFQFSRHLVVVVVVVGGGGGGVGGVCSKKDA